MDSFKNKALEYDSILEELGKEIRNKTESEVAPIGDDVYSKGKHVTPYFIKSVIELSSSKDKTNRYEWLDGQGWQLWAGNVISVGIESGEKHRELISVYSRDIRLLKASLLLMELRILRDDIFTRIDRCIGDSEYIHPHCVRCPIEQRASRKEDSQP